MRTLAVARAMLLALWRDRGALLLSFVIPVVFFVIFAEVVVGAAGGDLRLRLVVVDEVASDESGKLLAALAALPSVRAMETAGDRNAARELVRRGTADAGLVIRADGEPLTSAGGFGQPPLLLLGDPARAVIADVLAGMLQRAYFSALPDVPLRNAVELVGSQFTEFSATQEEEIDEGLASLRRAAAAGAQVGWTFEDLLEREQVAGRSAAQNQVAYYAGAIAFMFLLLAAAQGALTLIDEIENGIVERVAATAGGAAVVISGKFVYLTGQGLVQATLIFLAAWLVYGVDLPALWLPWLLVTACSAIAAAGIGLALVAVSRTRGRAQAMPLVVVVMFSAVGGSMVPRFLMPGWLQDVGWLTPNTWALEAYSGVFWRDASTPELLLPCILLVAVGLLAWLGAQRSLRRLIDD